MPTALITGSSRGIGKAFAEELASRGYDLILAARTESDLIKIKTDLEQRYSVNVAYALADLCKEDSVEQVINTVKQNASSLEILVNNAGYAYWGKFNELDLRKQEEMMYVNMNLLVKLCHRLVPLMKTSRKSYILNVSSSSAYQAVPTIAVYCASKAFVLQFSRALRLELKNEKISVSCISPGPTETNFMEAAGMNSPTLLKNAAKFNMSPEKVARIGIEGLLKGKAEIIPGFLNQVQAKLVSWVPKSLTEKIAANLYK
ncbi:MAG: SDR family NAD(P)-dependent oxidoreductase [Bacteroidetes bacterium]|nr:MAG: SDR family NAD(P)-dependent oxidoreductase [Bacteroidota bacterium]REJ99768.1 MAG: SDR family NAD(P)-dependent oxidoreductase [Bacteroidota bacterium]REK34141.1 MAG: SDR family NAD(P)-dependent oxidoreductase [Bacteroidota bacterium]REK50471.1 MAG: SDR family NAD(P)-dependent oxidoreductase [Bacteroidota bacterium]